MTPVAHLSFLIPLFLFLAEAETSTAEEELFKDLFAEYNRLIRPVENNTDILPVEFGLTMSQLIDVVSIGNRGVKCVSENINATTLSYPWQKTIFAPFTQNYQIGHFLTKFRILSHL